MGYEDLIRSALEGEAVPLVIPEAKFFSVPGGLTFPVLFTKERAARPFQTYRIQTRATCFLCASAAGKKTSQEVVKGMEWLASQWPIKANHGIVYPLQHSATILESNICQMGAFADLAGDAVAGINMRGSGASVPEHFHFQLHDRALFVNGGRSEMSAFPLLDCMPELFDACGDLKLYRLPTYPAYVLFLDGPWELLGRWLMVYLAGVNARPHNFALVSGGRLVVIPRGLDKAPNQQNRYGASEMLGLISPVTYDAYCAIQNAGDIVESLQLCGLADRQEQAAVEEHAGWVMEYVSCGSNEC